MDRINKDSDSDSDYGEGMLYKKKMVPLAGPVIGITNIGGARSSVCGRSNGVCQACTFFSATPLL